jgi:hypothetical protein
VVALAVIRWLVCAVVSLVRLAPASIGRAVVVVVAAVVVRGSSVPGASRQRATIAAAFLPAPEEKR